MDFAATLSAGTSRRRVLDMRRPRHFPVTRADTDPAEPWDFLSSVAVEEDEEITGYTVTLESGDVEIHGETQAGTTTSYVTPANLTLTISTSGTVYLWVEAAWSGSAWSASLGSGTSKPNDTGSAYRKLLWSFLNGVPAKRWHRGNVEFVGWRMLE
jgi:hypothetical protein